MHGHMNVRIAESVELLRRKMQKQGHRGFHLGRGNHSYLFSGYITVLGFTQSPIRIRKEHKIYNAVKEKTT